MKIKTGKVAEKDLIAQYLPSDYTEVLQCVFFSEKNITPDDIQVAFWTNSPQWIKKMFKLRDILVKPLGIKPGNENDKLELAKSIRLGENYRFISIPAKSIHETLLCMNDKHLVMYFSAKIISETGDKKKLTITTLVNFHNLLGRLYFYIIYPFHCIIVKSMIKNAVSIVQ
ncbi:DUF2867 domain-containing protein [Apibacter raozihei]|uniref:DUF2867 domain-containing protein n=1 Tax=Apibacter raozihei TaxID=2500547 RepID=UPI000FE3F649|nr:DUF2867 domain-containing protein [Apibacter raozihei]